MRGLSGLPLSFQAARYAAGAILFTALLFSPTHSHAQLMDQLKGAAGGQTGGALGGAGVPSVGQAGMGNTAGVLQYCIKNNYLSGGSAASVKDGLMSKVNGSGGGEKDSGFQAGNKGILSTGNGQSYSLGGGGIKAQVTHKVCDQILQHGKSML